MRYAIFLGDRLLDTFNAKHEDKAEERLYKHASNHKNQQLDMQVLNPSTNQWDYFTTTMIMTANCV